MHKIQILAISQTDNIEKSACGGEEAVATHGGDLPANQAQYGRAGSSVGSEADSLGGRFEPLALAARKWHPGDHRNYQSG